MRDLNDGVCDADLSTDGDQCTLRAAIQEANSREGEDNITFESGVSSISPQKSLPEITETVTIDASSHSSSVEVNGSNAGKDTDGFSLKKGNLTIKNLTISGFSGNGVNSNGNGYAALENVMITANGRYGVLADGAVYINSDPSNISVLSPTSTTTSVISANGSVDDGGGVWSRKDSVNAAYVEIKDNKGAGVAAKKNIALEAFTISGNKGPGVQSLSGGISVYGTSDHSEDNQVTENNGPGIMAGTDMELKPLGNSKGKAKGNITIQTDVTISNNGGWGIIATGGDVAVNRVDATGDLGAVSSSTSVISGNGNTALECYTLNDNGKLVRISSEALESAGAGGIGAGGNMGGAILEITGNNGPGIVAKDNVNLKQLKINDNRGPGIQSRKGAAIIINGTSDHSEENQVMENQGPGIMSGTNMALKPTGKSKGIAKGSITITTDVNVSTNGGWGIIAPDGDVAVNRIDARGTTGELSSTTSIITGNGDTSRKCYVVGENGRLKQISSESLESAGAGGVGAGANMAGELLEITENNGPGIAAKNDIDLVQIKSSNNRGPGIQSLQGTIGINNGTSDYNEENHVMGNQGPGVMTGMEMNFSKSKFGKSIYFRTHVEVSGNAGWGIFSILGDVVINCYDYETQGKLSSYTSYVKENGDTGLACYIVNKKGYLSRLEKYSTGGIASGKNVAGYNLEVTDNTGTGIEVLHDLYMDTGKVCDNSEENLSVTGDIVSITDVEVCE
ncbi:MAG: hypothetical protein HYV59_02135 [Planctomycetes bacterium]|nr:hypothetical protein [Planctomycetota bacterium]